MKKIVLFTSIVLSSIVGLGAQDKQDKDTGGPIMIEAVKLDRPADFKVDVLPILKSNCLACHNAKDKEGELILETPADMLKGGENGPAIVPGKGAESMLINSAAHLKKPFMPPKKNKVEAKNLAPREIGLLKLWIDQGAKVSTAVTLDAPAWQPTPANWNPIYAAAVDADGQTAACGRAGRLYIYSVATGRLIAQPSDPALGGLAHRDAVQSIAFSPDGSLLATGGYRSIKIWRKQSPEQRIALDQTGEIKAATVSPDGRKLALATAENTITVYDLATGKASLEMKGHTDAVTSLRFTPDGALLASGSADKTARAWNITEGTETAKISTPAAVNAVEWTVPGKQLATGGADNLVRLWNLDAPAAPAKELKGHTAVVTALAMTGLGLLSASQDGKATLWNLETGAVAKSVAHGGPISALAASPDGKRWLTAGGPAAKLWNGETAAAVATLATDGAAKRRDRDAAQSLAFATTEVTYRTNKIKEAEAHKKAEEDEVKKSTDAVPPVEKDVKDKDDAFAKAKLARETSEKDLVSTALAIETGKAKLELATKALAISDPEQALLQAEADGAAALAALEEAVKKPETIETAKARVDSVNKMLAFARTGTALARAQAEKASADQALAGIPAPDKTLATGTAKGSADAKAKLDASSKAIEETKAKLAAATEDEAKKKAEEAVKKAEADRAAAETALQKAQKDQQAAEAALAEASKKFAEVKTRSDAAAAALAQAKTANDKARAALEGSRGAADQAIKTAEAAQKAAQPKVDTAKKAEEAAMHAVDISKANLESAKGRVEKAKAEVVAADKGIADANAALEKQKQDQARLDAEKKQSADAVTKAQLPFRSAAFSADGAWVALGGEDGRVYTFGADRGTDARALEPHARAVFATGLSADGALVSLAPDGTVIVRRAAPGWTLAKTIEPGPDSSKPPVDRVLALAFSPDGKLLASGGGIASRDGELLLWDPVEGKLVKEIAGAHSDSIYDVSWSPDGSLLASAGADKFARVSDPKTGKVIRNFEGHTNHVLAVAWNRTGRSIATAGADDVVKVWDAASGQQTRTIPGFTKQATKLRYVGFDASFVVAAGGVPVRLVQEAGNVARNYESGQEFMYTVALSADGGTLAAGSLDGVLRLWSTGTGTSIAVFPVPAK